MLPFGIIPTNKEVLDYFHTLRINEPRRIVSDNELVNKIADELIVLAVTGMGKGKEGRKDKIIRGINKLVDMRRNAKKKNSNYSTADNKVLCENMIIFDRKKLSEIERELTSLPNRRQLPGFIKHRSCKAEAIEDKNLEETCETESPASSQNSLQSWHAEGSQPKDIKVNFVLLFTVLAESESGLPESDHLPESESLYLLQTLTPTPTPTPITER